MLICLTKEKDPQMHKIEYILWDLLGKFHNEVNRLVDLEADAAINGGVAANLNLQPAKDELIKKAEEILNSLQWINARLNTQRPKTP